MSAMRLASPPVVTALYLESSRPLGRSVPERYGIGDGVASASSIVWPVRATIQTCLIVGGLGSSAPEESAPSFELACFFDGSGVVVGAAAAGAELSSFDAAGVVSESVVAGASGCGSVCDAAVVVVAGTAGGCTTTTTRRCGVADASVALACGPAAAPTAIPKPSMSSTAAPATRGEGSGQRGRLRLGSGMSRARGAPADEPILSAPRG